MESLEKNSWLVSYPDDGNAVCFGIEDNSFWYQHRNLCILNAVQANNLHTEFYDIGGGNGVTAQVLQNAGYDVTLVEPYATGINNSKLRGIKKTIQATLEDFALSHSQINAVGFFDVMEHIEDHKAFLSKINQILNLNGKIILTVPAFQDLWSDNDVQLGHFRRYKLSQLERLANECGFEITYKTYMFSLIWIPMWLIRVIPNRLGIRIFNSGKKKEREHLSSNQTLGLLLRKLLRWEVSYIKDRKVIGLGTSCLIVAQKIKEL